METVDDDDIEPPVKKTKSDSEIDKAIQTQNAEFHDLRKEIKEYVDVESQKQILKYNEQAVPGKKREVKICLTYHIFFKSCISFEIDFRPFDGCYLFWCTRAMQYSGVF